MYRKHQAYLKGLVGDEFEEIPPHLFRLFVTGEIVSAESFEYDHLHVEYFLDLPSLWTCDSSNVLVQFGRKYVIIFVKQTSTVATINFFITWVI